MIIYKYELAITDCQTIKVGDPKAKPIAVAEQNGKLMLWVELDETCMAGDAELHVAIIGTGNRTEVVGEHLGSVVMPYGLVWHVYLEI